MTNNEAGYELLSIILVIVYLTFGMLYADWSLSYHITMRQFVLRAVLWWIAIPYDVAIHITHKRRLCKKLASVLPVRMRKNLFWKSMNVLQNMEDSLCKKTDLRQGREKTFWQTQPRNIWSPAQPLREGAAMATKVSHAMVGRFTPADQISLK